jgi:hypothetical protein
MFCVLFNKKMLERLTYYDHEYQLFNLTLHTEELVSVIIVTSVNKYQCLF